MKSFMISVIIAAVCVIGSWAAIVSAPSEWFVLSQAEKQVRDDEKRIFLDRIEYARNYLMHCGMLCRNAPIESNDGTISGYITGITLIGDALRGDESLTVDSVEVRVTNGLHSYDKSLHLAWFANDFHLMKEW